MKYSSFPIVLTTLLAAAIFIHSPAIAQHHKEMHATTDDAKVRELRPSFTNLDKEVSAFSASIMKDYLSLKSALVGSNQKAAASQAALLTKHLNDFDKSYFRLKEKQAFDKLQPAIRTHADAIAKSGLAEQRQHFKSLSEAMYAFATLFATGRPLYHEYCPMYEGGALWLSDARQIENPYFGSKMMHCGSVKEVIR